MCPQCSRGEKGPHYKLSPSVGHSAGQCWRMQTKTHISGLRADFTTFENNCRANLSDPRGRFRRCMGTPEGTAFSDDACRLACYPGIAHAPAALKRVGGPSTPRAHANRCIAIGARALEFSAKTPEVSERSRDLFATTFRHPLLHAWDRQIPVSGLDPKQGYPPYIIPTRGWA